MSRFNESRLKNSDKAILSVIGLGYVGLVTAAGFGLKGHKVVGIDVDKEKIEDLCNGLSPLYEEGLDEAIKNMDFTATKDYQAVLDTNITFLCINTPSHSDGSMDLNYLKKATEQLAEVLKQENAFHLVVVRSTVTPGTTEEVIVPILRNSGDPEICVNPEFLREGKAPHDFMNPSRIVIGDGDGKSGDLLQELYRDFGCPILRTDLKTAEMIKYASNAFLATKISFINEIGNICKKIGLDVYEVARGMGHDERIGDQFLNAGIGFGGSCLPKDLKGIVAKAREVGYEPRILDEVLGLNEEQPLRMVELLKKHIPLLKGKVIGILGLAFKPDTDDIRDSKAIAIVEELLKEGAQVRAYDPKAMLNFKKYYPQIDYKSPEEVLQSDATLILTEWDEFKNLDYTNRVIIDGRRILNARKVILIPIVITQRRKHRNVLNELLIGIKKSVQSSRTSVHKRQVSHHKRQVCLYF